MLGRGAIADPFLFERLRGRTAAEPDRKDRAAQLHRYLLELLARYRALSCGDTQVLGKLKGVLATMDDPCFDKHFKELLMTKELRTFAALLDGLE
jgi:tRNA-dihydrouridine synthase B